MSAATHIEWLSLVETTGPFLAVSVLDHAMPQGLEKVLPPQKRRIRSAYEEWCEAVDESDPLLEGFHREWIRLVVEELLEYDRSILQSGGEIPETLSYQNPQTADTICPDFVVVSEEKPKLLITTYPPGTLLDSPLDGEPWAASPLERMTLMCRAKEVPIGIVTNGERWTIVGALPDGTTSYGSWFARIWLQEPITLQAFQTLLGVRRCFGPEPETLEALLTESLKHRDEVTDTLGEQVRRAIEVLVQALDRADLDRDRQLLKDVSPKDLYDAGLTVMMRLVFILCAEERKLLLLGEPTYDQHYAVSTLRSQLLADAEHHGLEVLERRHDAWSRVLAVFRGVFAGIEHEDLRLPALGGSLFNPDEYPFLEGRAAGTTWEETPAIPLPIDNRTVLMLLSALQVLEVSSGAQHLSYESLDVEQVGHVYEGLLERTAQRVPEATLGLIGTAKFVNPNLALRELEDAAEAGEDALVALIQEKTGRSKSALRNASQKEVPQKLRDRLLSTCGGGQELSQRILPFANHLRTDNWDDPLVYSENAFVVALGTGRRETGTHYTPKSLTEPIVKHTLEPLIYVGPAEGKVQSEWKLKNSAEILEMKVCDLAMGSGAFLVQACRWLGDRLVEAWDVEERADKVVSINGIVSEGPDGGDLLPADRAERILVARRLVSSRCLYGVDINPMAVELAKLSLWLVTLMKNRPFGFLDHALRCGDSLLGVSSIQQIKNFSLRSGDRQVTFATADLSRNLEEASTRRRALKDLPSNEHGQIDTKNRLHAEAEAGTSNVKFLADCLVAFELRGLNGKAYEDQRTDEAEKVQLLMKRDAEAQFNPQSQTITHLAAYAREQLGARRPFNWPVEFPEVFASGGFDAFVGNPPFVGNKYWAERFYEGFQKYAEILTGGKVGKIDAVALFFRRAFALLSNHGRCGLIATTTAREGSTLRVGFAWISKNGELFRAMSQRAWPGKAGVHICVVWFGRSTTNTVRFLDEKAVEAIPPSLSGFTISGRPFPLVCASWAFQGSDNSKGGCFILHQEDPWFTRLKEAGSPFFRPYVTGEDITEGSHDAPERWCVDCQDLPLEEVRTTCPDAYHFLMEDALPHRSEDNLAPYQGLISRWWQMWNHRAPLYRRLRKAPVCIGFPMVSKHLDVVLLPTHYVFTNKVCLLEKPDDAQFEVLLSSFFEAWILEHGGTMGAGRLKIVLSTTIRTFPYPESSADSGQDGQRFYAYRKGVIIKRGEGLTKIYNRFHSPDKMNEDIIELRELHRKLDKTVASAYGWRDLDLGHGFHPTKQGERYTISESARREILDRLLALNHQRYAEEVAAGLHDKKAKKKSAGKTRKQNKTDETKNQSDLF